MIMLELPGVKSVIGRWERAIDKLVELTQDEKIKWRVVNPGEYLPNEETHDTMLLVEQNEKHLLLYKTYVRHVPHGGAFWALTGSMKKETDYQAELVFYDPETKTILYRFPRSDLIEDLYKAATFNTSGVQEFIDRLLGDPPE